MTGRADDGAHAAVVLDPAVSPEARVLDRLRADPAVAVIDRLAAQRRELRGVVPAPDAALVDEPARWVYFPWRDTVVHLLGPRGFRRLRTDRNRNKITAAEQEALSGLAVGIVGLSVGHVVAVALAQEGACGALRLADFDTLEVSNLNRLPASVLDFGVGKAVIAARRIAEIDPYLPVTVWPEGLEPATAAEFVAGLDVVVDECDSLDVKVAVRHAARAARVPVLMETSDRGLLDVERFDLEPDRPVFHGLLGDLDVAALAGLATRDKVPHVLRLLGAADLSPRMAASLLEVGETISTWPQLAGDVLLGGASIAAAVRRLGLGEDLRSGRCRIDLADRLELLDEPDVQGDPAPAGPQPAPEVPADAVSAVLHAASRAPSGGNSQPWRVTADAAAVTLSLAPGAGVAMDVAHRAGYVAIGAALHNVRVAAAAHGVLGPVRRYEPRAGHPVVAMEFGDGDDPALAGQYEDMLRRHTNRRPGTPAPIGGDVARALADAAHREGATLHLATDRDTLVALADLMAASDRIRYLTPRLHADMISELCWPTDAPADTGIEVRSLELDRADEAALDLVRRADVMDLLARWDAGTALGTITRDRVRSGSAWATVTVAGRDAHDYVRGGAAVESVWIHAHRCGLAVHPMSPVFLFASTPEEVAALAPAFAARLDGLRRSFLDVLGVPEGRAVALTMRLGHAPAATFRSRRRRDTAQRVSSRV